MWKSSCWKGPQRRREEEVRKITWWSRVVLDGDNNHESNRLRRKWSIAQQRQQRHLLPALKQYPPCNPSGDEADFANQSSCCLRWSLPAHPSSWPVTACKEGVQEDVVTPHGLGMSSGSRNSQGKRETPCSIFANMWYRWVTDTKWYVEVGRKLAIHSKLHCRELEDFGERRGFNKINTLC